MIRSLLLSAVSSIALASAAFASDLPTTKGPATFVPPPPPEFTWTGFYVGGNAGLSGGDFDKGLSGVLPDGGAPFWEEDSATGYGFSGGGQIGYNYQFPTTNFVVGVEADFQGSTLRGTYWNSNDSTPEGEKAQSQVDWWGTARGRLGYAFGNILPYATGGFAYGRVENSYSYWPTAGSGSYGFTQTGWTAGGGVEYAVTHNLTLKVEYLYTDLGPSSETAVPDASYTLGPGTWNTSTKTTFNTVRAGLNWKFDWMAPWAPPTPFGRD